MINIIKYHIPTALSVVWQILCPFLDEVQKTKDWGGVIKHPALLHSSVQNSIQPTCLGYHNVEVQHRQQHHKYLPHFERYSETDKIVNT